eukprot:6133684-Prymnesium_polylepis.3
MAPPTVMSACAVASCTRPTSREAAFTMWNVVVGPAGTGGAALALRAVVGPSLMPRCAAAFEVALSTAAAGAASSSSSTKSRFAPMSSVLPPSDAERDDPRRLGSLGSFCTAFSLAKSSLLLPFDDTETEDRRSD